MPKFIFHMGVTLRSYGNVEVEAETVEAALPLLTADFIGDNIAIHETTTDSGQDLAIIDVSSNGGAEELDEWSGHSLPSPYDTQPAHANAAMLAALEKILEGSTVDGRWLDESGNECEETAPGARYEQYNGEEQDAWIASVADLARDGIAKGKAASPPADPVSDAAPAMLAALDGLINNGFTAEGLARRWSWSYDAIREARDAFKSAGGVISVEVEKSSDV